MADVADESWATSNTRHPKWKRVCLLTTTGVLMLVDNGLPNPDRGTAWLTQAWETVCQINYSARNHQKDCLTQIAHCCWSTAEWLCILPNLTHFGPNSTFRDEGAQAIVICHFGKMGLGWEVPTHFPHRIEVKHTPCPVGSDTHRTCTRHHAEADDDLGDPWKLQSCCLAALLGFQTLQSVLQTPGSH